MTKTTSRWADEPGYHADIQDPHIRRRHRDAIRAAGLREERAETAEPSHHQMCSLILDAVAMMLWEDGSRGPAMAQAFTQAFQHTCEVEGWRTRQALLDRVMRRLTPEPDVLRDFMKSLRVQRSEAAVVAARDAARRERAERLRVLTMRRHGLDVIVPHARDPFDDAYFGDDEDVAEK